MSLMVLQRQSRLALALLAVAIFLVLATLLSEGQRLSPDAVSYLRVGQYYGSGAWSLAVNGYWGPAISWLMAPLIASGFAPFAAGNLAGLAGAAMFVFAAVIFLSRVLDRPVPVLIGGAFSVAFAVLAYLDAPISPDLLLGGFLLLGFAITIGRSNGGSAFGAPFATGLCFGLAYIAKAVGLPVGVAFLTAHYGLRAFLRVSPPAKELRNWAISLARHGAKVAPSL